MARPASMSTSDLVQTQRLKRNKSWCAPPYRLETKPGATRGPAGGICGGHHVCSEYWFLWPVSLGAIFEWQESRSGGSGRNTLRVSRFRLPLAIPCPILRCAEISQQRSGSALVSCTGERPSRWGRGRGRGMGGERGEGRGWECVASVFLPRPTCSIGMFECSREFKSWIQDGTLPPKCRNFEMSNVQNAPSESRVQESRKSRQKKGQGSLPGPLPGV